MSKRDRVVEYLWQVLRPCLHVHGFLGIARAHAYRDHDHTIDVIKVEFFNGPSHRVWGTSTQSFGLSCGVFLKCAPNPFGGHIETGASGTVEPDATVCAIRTHLIRDLTQPKNVPNNVWSVTADCSDLKEIGIDVLQAFESKALRWFAALRPLDAIVSLLENADEVMDGAAPCFGFGRRGSPVRNLYLGFAAAARGQSEKARNTLIESMSKGGFAKLSGSTAVDECIKRKIEELGKSVRS